MNQWAHGISGGQVSFWYYLSMKSDNIEIWEFVANEAFRHWNKETNDRFAWDVCNSIIELVLNQ